MCGICGIVSLDGSRVDPAVLESMNEALFHRGPDSGGSFVDGHVGLAARRLAIIDLAGGDQPISNEDGTIWVVQNGEIYNYRELRAELERARSPIRDAERHRGARPPLRGARRRFVDRLRGMFAIALWDGRERRLVLARDRFGIKPLYYRSRGRTLVVRAPSSRRSFASPASRARSISMRSTPTWRSCSSLRRSRSSAMPASFRPAACSSGREGRRGSSAAHRALRTLRRPVCGG